MANNREAGNRNQEQNEVRNNNASQYVFPESHYDEFIEKRLEGNLCYFSENKLDSQTTVNDFWSFLQANHPEDTTKTEKESHEKKLKRKILQVIAPIDDAMDILKRRFESDFSLTDDQKGKLNQILSEKKLSELKYYIASTLGRAKLLQTKKQILGEVSEKVTNKNDEQLLVEIFGGLDISKIKENKDFMESLYAFINAKKVTLNDVKTLFEGLSQAHQVKLLQYFVPAISLQEAVKSGVYSKKDAYLYLEGKLGKYLDDAEEKKSIAKEIDFSAVMISTTDLNNLNTVGEDFLKKFAQEYEQNRLDALRNDPIRSKKEFLKVVQDSDKISSKYKTDSQKLQTGGYYQMKIGDEITTFFVKSLPDIGENAEVVNVTVGKDGKSITKGNTGKSSFLSYNDFVDLFQVATKDSKISVDVFTSEEFEQKAPEQVPQTLEEIETPEELLQAMDEVDPDGRGIKLEQTSFACLPDTAPSTLRGDIFDNAVYKIHKIENGHVFLEKEKLTFAEFIAAFRERKPKRFKTLPTAADFLSEMKNSDDYKDVFDKVECKNGNFLKKSDGKDENQKMEYFISDKNDKKAIQIISAGHGAVTFKEGDYKEATRDEKEKGMKGKFDVKGTTTVPYGVFAKYIEGKKYQPHLKKTSIKETEDIKAKELKNKKGFFAAWGGFASPKELVSALKQITSAVEHHLEEGNKLKAAKLALAMGKVLPESIRLDLQNMVESEQKKSMEEIMDKLKGMNSRQMVDTIFKYVETSAPGDPKLEAAMMTMMEKYGNLYNKAEEKRGNYIWYQALGGKVGDALFMKIKKDCEEAALQNAKKGKPQPVPFTEEKLVEALLKKQVDPNSEYYPKRRSKLDKAFGGAMNSGIEEEMKDGENKTGDMMTLNGRLGYIMSEFAAGGYANGVGGIPKVWGKGGTPTEMNAPAFVLTMSGITKDFPEVLLNKLIGLSWDSPYPMMLYNLNDKYRKLFQNTVKDLVDQLKDSEPKEEFKKAMAKSGGKKIEALYEFWMTYGDELSHHLTLRVPDGNMLMLMKEKGENQNYSDYVEFYNGMMTDDEYNMKSDDISNGRYGTGGVGHPINPDAGRKYYDYYLKIDSNASLSNDARGVFETAIQQLASLRQQEMPDNDKKIIYSKFVSALEPAIRRGAGGRLEDNVFKRSSVAIDLKRVGIDMDTDVFKLDPDKDIQPGKTGTYAYVESENFQKYIDRCFERFMKNTSVQDTMNNVSENTRKSALEILEGLKNAA